MYLTINLQQMLNIPKYLSADCSLFECCNQKSLPIVKLLASKDEALLVGWNALLVLYLHLDIVNCVR